MGDTGCCPNSPKTPDFSGLHHFYPFCCPNFPMCCPKSRCSI
nr:MAG TPA: cuticle protein [Caudoviricetes sp.]